MVEFLWLLVIAAGAGLAYMGYRLDKLNAELQQERNKGYGLVIYRPNKSRRFGSQSGYYWIRTRPDLINGKKQERWLCFTYSDLDNALDRSVDNPEDIPNPEQIAEARMAADAFIGSEL